MYTKFQMPISSSSLVTVMTTAKEISHVANLLLFYFVHKNIAWKNSKIVLKCKLLHIISWFKHASRVALTAKVLVFSSLLLPVVGNYFVWGSQVPNTRSKFHGDRSTDSNVELKRDHADGMEVTKSCLFISYDRQ